MNLCKKCILDSNFPETRIDENGVCNHCNTHKVYEPIGEEALKAKFEKAKRKKRTYDVLVPFSGGKDSSYIIYLAKNVYKLKVLAFTYDNGFFSSLALENIQRTIKLLNVDHIFYHTNQQTLLKIYRQSLVASGDLCGVCGIGIMNSIQKISHDWRIPLILLGHSPVEDGSFSPEDIYDVHRLKTILKERSDLSSSEIKSFLIYPKMNYFSTWVLTKLGYFGEKINPLYYIPMKTDNEIAEILKKEIGWQDSQHSGFTKHFDCIIEPFTNYVRDRRFGYSRRVGQLSTMVRNGEIDRDEALSVYNMDNTGTPPSNIDQIKDLLDLSNKDIDDLAKIEPNKYKWALSKENRIFRKVRTMLHVKHK